MSRHALRLLLAALLSACGAPDAPQDDDTGPADTDAPSEEPLALIAATPVPGERLVVRVVGAAPGAAVVFLHGSALGTGDCPARHDEVCVDVLDPVLLGEAVVDADGAARADLVLPEDTVVGGVLAFQALLDGEVLPAVEARVSAPLAIAGVWVDDFGSEHEIETRRWLSFGSAEIVAFSNEARHAVARNGDGSAAPGRWSRYDWTFVGDELWYCQSMWDAPSFAAAFDAPAPDASAPAETGCGGFAWSRLVPGTLALAGTYTDVSDTHHVIDGTLWDQGFAKYHVARFSNAERWVIARNDDANDRSPGLWSRFDWTEVDGDLWYCQTRDDAATELAARESAPADPTDPAETGCGGFAWTLLTP